MSYIRINNPHDFQGSILLLIDLFNEVSVVVYIHAYVYMSGLVSFSDPTVYIGSGERVGFCSPCRNVGRAHQIALILLHNPLYVIYVHWTQMSLRDASGIYGFIRAS